MIALIASSLLACANANPNAGRVLINIVVTPATADAQSFPGKQVTFTATGSYSLPPITGPVTFAAPYTGSFSVDNPTSQTIATVVSSGTGTVTVQCASGASGSVAIVASASSNNLSGTVVTGNAQLTCP